MDEKKLTDEEIVKALDCCVKEEHKDCVHCGEFVSQFDCMRNAISNALDLIRRLQADNRQLKGFVSGLEDEKKVESIIFGLKETIGEQKAEIERLKDEFKTDYRNSWKNKFFGALEENRELQKQVNELKAENAILNKQVDRKDKAIVREMNIGYENERQAVKDTAKEIYSYLNESGVIKVAPDTIKLYFKENYGIEVE